MLASKSKDTSLLESEKKTLKLFFLIYSFFAVVIILFSGVLYYNTQKELMFERQSNKLREDSAKLIKKLGFMHNNFHDGIRYPRFKNFNSAIYDSSGKLIFSTLEDKSVNLNSTIYKVGDKIHYIRLLNSFYLGAMYVVIEVDDTTLGSAFVMDIAVFSLVLFLILLIAGYFLGKLLLKPMKDTLYLLNRFIKDTTHELNTPVTSIMTNIEMIDRTVMHEKNLKKLKRIDAASKTISNLYEDLTFVALGNRVEYKDEELDIKELIHERGEYFKTLAESKKIEIKYDLQECSLFADRSKISRVIDNLLSNAVKYNKYRGYIMIRTSKNSFSIEDNGIGIKKEDLENICQRYARFNDSEGGFGIGLSIVKAIVQSYELDIKFESSYGKGTKVTLSW